MDMWCTAHLKLHPIGILLNLERTESVHDDSFDEGLDSLIKVPGGCMRVLPDKFMFSRVCREKCLNCHPVDLNFFLPSSVAVGDGFILQKTGEVLMISVISYCDTKF